MVRSLSLVLAILCSISAYGQNDFLEQIKIFKLNDPVLKEIQFSVYKKDINKKKPLLVFLGGVRVGAHVQV